MAPDGATMRHNLRAELIETPVYTRSMPRSMWRGAISFGMVAIPVRMYLATESKGVSFRLLCPNDGAPLKNKRWCPVEDREVGWNETVRGFEVGKDEYVRIEDDDLENLPLQTTHAIDILEFCDDSEIDAGLYVTAAYYLEPEAVGVKPYYLLKKALEKTGRVAIGKVAIRERERLVRLALHEKGIVLNTLHWPDEVRDINQLNLPEDEAKIAKGELDMAVMLVENLAARFDPSRYHDEYREAVDGLVEAKLKDQPLEQITVPEPAKVTDLMAALKASVEQAQTKHAGNGHEEAVGRKSATAARKKKAS
jgi:DNA end-binding protein Ku